MKTVELYFDGGIRKNIMAYGFLLIDTDTREILFKGKNTCGKGKIASSNLAEYRALIAGLQKCINENIKNVHIIGDSQLIVKQVNRVFKINKQDLIEHCNKVWELLEFFDEWSLKWVPREENKQADALVNEAFIKKFGPKKGK